MPAVWAELQLRKQICERSRLRLPSVVEIFLVIYLQRVVCGMFADNSNSNNNNEDNDNDKVSAYKQIADAFCQPYGPGLC